MTHYEVLGVAPDASPAEVRRAYVRLARQHHPDFFAAAGPSERHDAEQRMRAINQAWTVLGVSDRRRRYDQEHRLGRAGAADDDGGRFRPFDVGDDDIDPRDLPDEPYRREGAAVLPPPRALTLAPVLAFATSVGLLAVGMVVNSVALLALAVAAFLVACLGFVVLPLLALSRASRDE